MHEQKHHRRIGVFGGTFDPVHVGHLIIATEMLDQLDLDSMLFVPTGRPPHKVGERISPVVDRLRMLELALADNPRFQISLVDVERPGLSYTADMLALLHEQYPCSTLFFIMGEDSLRDLHTWHQPNRVANQAMLAVAARPGIDVETDEVVRQVPAATGRIVPVPIPLIGISSTDLRERVASDRPISYQVPPAVERYILQRGLYRDPA